MNDRLAFRLAFRAAFRAKKPRLCYACWTCVDEGERYVRSGYVIDGDIREWITCAACDDITVDVFKWAGSPADGIISDDFYAWAKENVDENSGASEYLRRFATKGETS